MRRLTPVTSSTTKGRSAPAYQVLCCIGLRSRTPWCPQAWILSCGILSYRQGCVQDDQDPLEDGKEDRWSQGREPTGTFSIRKRRSRIRTHCPSFCRTLC